MPREIHCKETRVIIESSIFSNLVDTYTQRKKRHNDLKERNIKFSLFSDDTIIQAGNSKLLEGKEDLLDLISRFNNVTELKINYITVW